MRKGYLSIDVGATNEYSLHGIINYTSEVSVICNVVSIYIRGEEIDP